MDGLMNRSDQFIEKHVARALRRISVPEKNVVEFNIASIGKKDLFGRTFYLQHENVSFKMWVGLNVNKIFVIYFIQYEQRDDMANYASEVFKFTFGGAKDVGFKTYYETFKRGGKDYLSIWMTAVGEKDFLTNPTEKLFWSQDIAMMTKSFVRTASRHGLVIDTTILPGPL